MHTGTEGIQLANLEHPDLVLMDINLPDMSSEEALGSIHNLPHMEHVPVVAITTEDTDELRRQCLEQGFDAYLTVPMSQGRLLRVVQTVMNH